MWSKSAVTERILLSLPEANRPTFQQAMQAWWQTATGGMRLTRQGIEASINAELPTYRYAMPPGLERIGRILLVLDGKLDCPYYIELRRAPEIVLFGAEQAAMLSLYGDFEKWVSYLQRT